MQVFTYMKPQEGNIWMDGSILNQSLVCLTSALFFHSIIWVLLMLIGFDCGFSVVCLNGVAPCETNQLRSETPYKGDQMVDLFCLIIILRLECNILINTTESKDPVWQRYVDESMLNLVHLFNVPNIFFIYSWPRSSHKHHFQSVFHAYFSPFIFYFYFCYFYQLIKLFH